VRGWGAENDMMRVRIWLGRQGKRWKAVRSWPVPYSMYSIGRLAGVSVVMLVGIGWLSRFVKVGCQWCSRKDES
jgi:hypothetical protein